MTEIEAKLRVEDLRVIRQQLEAVGGQFVGRYEEDNRIFDASDGWLRSAGCGLRIRAVKTLAGELAPATLTYKGPAMGSAFKRREEIETTVDDSSAAGEILMKLGFVETMSYRKTRERWSLDGCHVELDDVPLLGTFVEIEGGNERVIDTVRGKLGLGDVDHESRSYVRMLVVACEQMGRLPIGVGFEEQ